MILNRLREYVLLTRLNKPIGIYLLLWPTLWALWFAADGFPDLRTLVIFIVGVVLMRSAGCVINDFADRKIDPHVERTKNRPIAAGRVKPVEALIVFSVLCVSAFVLVLQLNTLTIQLSFIAVVLAASYPFMKRFTYLPQAHLGAAFGMATPMAFAATTGGVPLVAWVLYGLTLIWAVAYDTMYAMCDREDDLKVGVKSTAILFGHYDRLIVGLLQLLLVTGLVYVGQSEGRGLIYFSGIALAALLLVYQQWLIRERENAACFKAFLNNSWFGFIVFIGLALDFFSGYSANL